MNGLVAKELSVGDTISLRHGMPWYSGKDMFPIGFMHEGTKLEVLKITFDGSGYHVKAKFLGSWFNFDNLQEMNLNESSLVFFEKVSSCGRS